MTTPIKIIIADDHLIFREGLKLLLKKLKSKEIEIIAEAENGKELIDFVEKHSPDVVLIDIQMPVINGIEATRILTDRFPDVGIIALSTFNDEGMVIDMLYAGARGYLLKNTNKEELLAAIKKVNAGEVYYSAETAVHLFPNSGANDQDISREKIYRKLTEKEIEVIKLLCRGLTNKEIASEMNLSKRTVEGYRENIMKKINAKNAIDIMAFAIRNKIYTV